MSIFSPENKRDLYPGEIIILVSHQPTEGPLAKKAPAETQVKDADKKENDSETNK